MSDLLYYARWWGPAATALADVSFKAPTLLQASRKADRAAREVRMTNTPRTLQVNGVVVQSIPTGVAGV